MGITDQCSSYSQSIEQVRLDGTCSFVPAVFDISYKVQVIYLLYMHL